MRTANIWLAQWHTSLLRCWHGHKMYRSVRTVAEHAAIAAHVCRTPLSMSNQNMRECSCGHVQGAWHVQQS